MKPIDFRNETWRGLQNRISGSRAAVLTAWRRHGPCTTEDLAKRCSLSLLSLRPRTTELLQLGFVCLADDQASSSEGTYRAREHQEWLSWVAAQQAAARNIQRELPLTP